MSKNKQKEWNIEWLDVADIKPYENNPRDITDAVPLVVKSISRFGFRVPLVIDKDNIIVCGHTRLAAAKELEMTRLPCVRADDLTPEQIKAFRLADNKVAEASSWDFDLLDVELDSLANFGMGDFGFSVDAGDAQSVYDGLADDETQTKQVEREAHKLSIEVPSEYFDVVAKWWRKGGKDATLQYALVSAGVVNDDAEDDAEEYAKGEGEDA